MAEIQSESQQKQMKATSTVSSMPFSLMNSIIYVYGIGSHLQLENAIIIWSFYLFHILYYAVPKAVQKYPSIKKKCSQNDFYVVGFKCFENH